MVKYHKYILLTILLSINQTLSKTLPSPEISPNNDPNQIKPKPEPSSSPTPQPLPTTDPSSRVGPVQDEPRVFYNQSQLWNTFIENINSIEILAKLRDQGDILMWGGNATSVDILVKPPAREKVRETLSENRVRFQVAIEDLQKAIDEENPPVTIDEETIDRNGHNMHWQNYHRMDTIHEYLSYLAQTYPTSCQVLSIGRSSEGREIPVIKISGPGSRINRRAIWVDGGIHAREWISPATVTYIINQLLLNWENQPEYVRNMDWYIAPLLNPDGYEYTHRVDRLWRKNRGRTYSAGNNCVGTDLNRNFGYKWGGQGSSKNPCAETYGGTGAFSEPETAAINRFITQSGANWRAYVSFHSYGQYILFPWGYDRVTTDDYQDLNRVATQAANAIQRSGGPGYRVGPAGSTLYPASGGSDDWAKGTIGMKYSYTIELRDSGRYGFVLPAQFIDPTATEAFEALKVIAQAAYNTP